MVLPSTSAHALPSGWRMRSQRTSGGSNVKTWRTILGAALGLADGRGDRLGPGGRGLAGLGRREGFQRRRAPRRRGDDHQDRHRRRLAPCSRAPTAPMSSEPAGRPVPAEGRRCRASTPTCRKASSCRSTPIRRSTSRLAVGNIGEQVTVTASVDRPSRRGPTGVGQVIDNQQVTRDAAERPAGDRADLPLRPRHVGAGGRPRTPTRTIRPSPSRSPAGRPTASPTSWTAGRTTIRSTT